MAEWQTRQEHDGTYLPPGGTGCVCYAGVGSGVLIIDDPDGRWVGTLTEVSEDCTRLLGQTIQLTGEGSYKGLSAYLIKGIEDDHEVFEGLIFTGAMPPLPGALSPPTNG